MYRQQISPFTSSLFTVIFTVGFWLISSAAAETDPSTTSDSLSTQSVTQTVSSQDFRRMPVRTIEDWLALQPGVAVRYPGAKNIYIRGARDYSSAYLMNGSRVEDPMTGELAATFSPFALDRLSLQTGAFDGHIGDFTGGVVGAKSPALFKSISGSVEVTSDNFGSGFDQNWYNATLYGPLGEDTGLDFFAASERRYLGDRQPSPIAGDVLPNGEKALPGNSLEGWSHHGRITFAPCDKTTLSAWGDYSRDNFQTYRHEWYYYPEHAPRTEDELLSLGFGIERKLSQTVSLDVKAKYYSFERIHGDGVLFDDLAKYSRTVPNPGYDIFNLFRDTNGVDEPYYDYLLKQKSESWGGDAAMTVRPHPDHTLKFGVDARRYTVRRYENLGPTLSPNLYRVNNYGYDMLGEETDSEYFIDGVKHPVVGGVYVQDEIRQDRLTLTGAVRVDYFNYNGKMLIDSTHPLGEPDWTLGEEDLKETESFLRLSPRLTLAIDAGDPITLFAAFGIHHQLPPFVNAYQSFAFLEGRVTNGNFYELANAGLEPEKMQSTSFGLVYRPDARVHLSATAYSRRYSNVIRLTHIQSIPFSIDMLQNRSDLDAKGVELSGSVSPASYLSIGIHYNLSRTEGPGLRSQTYAWQNPQGAFADGPLFYDQTHKAVGVFEFHTGPGEGPRIGSREVLENVSFIATINMASGFRYTRSEVFDEVGAYQVIQMPFEEVNASQQPMILQVDLKLERTIPIGDFNIVPFLWIRNLLDRENVAYVYNGTGEPDYTGYLDTEEGQYRADDPTYGDDFLEQYLLRQQDPTNYAPPRQIYFGLRAEF